MIKEVTWGKMKQGQIMTLLFLLQEFEEEEVVVFFIRSEEV
jgi:hypothetical protein